MARPSAIRVSQHGQPRRQISRSPGRHSWPPRPLLDPDERPRQANLLGRLDARSIMRAASSRRPALPCRPTPAGPVLIPPLLDCLAASRGSRSSHGRSGCSRNHPVSFLSRVIARRYQMQPCIDEEPRPTLAATLHAPVNRPACVLVCMRVCCVPRPNNT